MTQIIKEGGKTIIKTGSRIDTMNANQFEQDIQPALRDGGVDLEMDYAHSYSAEGPVQDNQRIARDL